MEGAGYVDLFATKGIEYLLVLFFLLAFIAFWRVLNSPLGKQAPARASAVAAPAPWFRLQDGLFYHQGHSWAVPEGGDVVTVGVDDFAQKLLGRASGVELPAVGGRLSQARQGWRLRVASRAFDFLSPVDGEVVAVNEDVLRAPGLINDSPYSGGWLLKVRTPNLEANLKNLLRGPLAAAWMRETVARLRARMAGDVGPVLQDGGVPVCGIVGEMSQDEWDEIAREFLLT